MQRFAAVGAAATAVNAQPRPAGTASSASSNGPCPASTPVDCSPNGCCASGYACAASGCVAVPSGQCPSGAVACTAPPSCSGGCSALDASSQVNTATLASAARYTTGPQQANAPANVAIWVPSAASCGPAAATAPTAGFPTGDNPITIEAWIADGSVGGNVSNGMLVAGYGDRGFYISNLIGGNRIFLAPVPSSTCNVSAPVFDGAWHFVAVSYSAGTASFFIDGAAAGTCSVGPFSTTAGGQLSIDLTSGSAPGGCPQNLITEVRIVAAALSASQIAADYAQRRLAATAATVGLWHFDEGSPYRCCPSGASCAVDGNCSLGGAAVAPSPPSLPAGYSPCAGGGCPPGGTCQMSASGYTCGLTAAFATPGHACGGGTFCPMGLVCSSGASQCCDSRDPVDCGATCCPSGIPCAGQSCGCPSGGIPCGAQCCSSGAVCGGDGACHPDCAATPQFPTACGSATCCATGIACNGGQCQCPADHPVGCGAACCLAGAACTNGDCGCPSGHSVKCGDQCCPDGQSCVGGACQNASGGGTSVCDFLSPSGMLFARCLGANEIHAMAGQTCAGAPAECATISDCQFMLACAQTACSHFGGDCTGIDAAVCSCR